MSIYKHASLFVLALLVVAFVGMPVFASGYFKVQPLYIPYPTPNKGWTIGNYGPVGIGIQLSPPNFTMTISNVEKGSPADGKLRKGQVIESINGETLKDIDPRVQLANILTKAEATDGKMRFKIKGAGEVMVQLEVMGAFSETWPVNCEKSDKIVRKLADLIGSQEMPRWGSIIFLLSTGEEKDLEVVKRWMKDFNGVGSYPWSNGMVGPGVCEYYLRTGDQRMLPIIKRMCDVLTEQIYVGSWSGRGKASFTYMAGGHLNAAGGNCLAFLLLAKQCGVDVDEHTLQTALHYFYRFAGHGNVAYGDQFPEGGYRDNGKTAVLAVAMSAAATLTPDGESSIYARARDNAAMKSFYASSWFNRAHTGGGFGELWHAVAMQLVRESKPMQYRTFMDERRWHFELSRRHNGGFGIHDGARYDKSATDHSRAWGTYHALALTAHRKQLRLYGAPPSKWSKTYKLPDRPWGNKADDIFQSNEPGVTPSGKKLDMSKERLATHTSAPLMGMISKPGNSDEFMLMYALHPDHGIRSATMRTLMRQQRYHLVIPLLKSEDPRGRHSGILALTGMFKGPAMPASALQDEMFELCAKMIADPNEAWWVKQAAMQAMTRAKPKYVAPLVDTLVQWVEHDDWWMHTQAMKAVTNVAADDRFAPKVLPAVAKVVANGRAYQSSAPAKIIVSKLKAASPKVREMGLKLFKNAYLTIPDPVVAPGGQLTPNQTEVLRGRAYAYLRSMPGSGQLILSMPKETSRWQATRKASDMYVYDGKFIPNEEIMGRWVMCDQVGSISDFRFDKKMSIGKPAFNSITFARNGKTDNATRIWTGDTLIDLGRGEALKVQVKMIEVAPRSPSMKKQDDDDLLGELTNKKGDLPKDPFLFIEAGNFGGTKPKGWTTPYYVFRKAPDGRRR